MQKNVRKLAAGWFVDVQPRTSDAARPHRDFKVVERPVIRYVEYLGNKGIRDKKLAKETELKVGGPVDPYAVEEARRKLIALTIATASTTSRSRSWKATSRRTRASSS